MTSDEVQEVSLEESLERLDVIVSALEVDDLPLDEALALFEEGVGHVMCAETLLSAAETRVEELLRGDGGLETRPLDVDS